MGIVLFATAAGRCTADDAARTSFDAAVRPFLHVLSGKDESFQLTGSATFQVDGKPQQVKLALSRFSKDSFALQLTHEQYAAWLLRSEDATSLVLPLHKRVLFGEGEAAKEHHLLPAGILGRVVSSASNVHKWTSLASALSQASVLTNQQAALPGFLLTPFAKQLKLTQPEPGSHWFPAKGSPLAIERPGQLSVRINDVDVDLQVQMELPADASMPVIPEGFERVRIRRATLERTLCRGVHRATEILAPGPALTSPATANRKVSHGELRWVGGQRVVLLDGTPEQIGTAHGQLLSDEARRCIESVLFSFATGHAIVEGKWFMSDLESAWKELSPHIPERHRRETRALAKALDVDPHTLELLNVFPELFHCSGFAVADSATVGGKLYHGRVLDYMTTIGLQDAATTFIVKPNGYSAFANVGYASFTGSVTGMNEHHVSLGEMGGKGEGQWAGVPMATLMRRALEECSTLAEVMELWRDSPRTCEYFYVFADGKTNEMVGVSAVPEAIEFIGRGEFHKRLGEGIPDTVALSAGSRLATLKKRILAKHGAIDVETAKWLMSRPVAMQSNLHNVLFVPEDGDFYVANASHSRPAAEMPYVHLNLFELLNVSPQGRKPLPLSTGTTRNSDD